VSETVEFGAKRGVDHAAAHLDREAADETRVDTLVEQARRSLNQTEREKLYGEVQDILAREMVWIPGYTTKEIIATRAGVKGFTIHPVEYNLALWKTWLDK